MGPAPPSPLKMWVIKGMACMQVLPATYNPADPGSERQDVAALGALYLMMGRGLERLQVRMASGCLRVVHADGGRGASSVSSRLGIQQQNFTLPSTSANASHDSPCLTLSALPPPPSPPTHRRSLPETCWQ